MVAKLGQFPELLKTLAKAKEVEEVQLKSLQDLFSKAVNDTCDEYFAGGMDVNCVHLTLDKVEEQMYDVRETLAALVVKTPALNDCIAEFIAAVKESVKLANQVIVDQSVKNTEEYAALDVKWRGLKLEYSGLNQILSDITKVLEICDKRINIEHEKLSTLSGDPETIKEFDQHFAGLLNNKQEMLERYEAKFAERQLVGKEIQELGARKLEMDKIS